MVTAEVDFARPIAYAVPELEADYGVRARAARFIGQVATGESFQIVVDPGEVTASNDSLMDAIHKAEAGDVSARKLVEINVLTDVIERTIKSGHIRETEVEVDDEGQVQQNGQSDRSIQANSLRYASTRPQIRRRTEAETNNSFRIEHLYGEGVLEDNVFLVASLAADDLSLEAMEDEGFFTNTMSLSFQATTAVGHRRLAIQTAAVAGRRSPTEERHDFETIIRLGAMLGVDLSGKTAAEIINTPLLIPKRLMPNGVVDVVRWFDIAAGGTFFGEGKPQQDYLAYVEQCRQREAELASTAQRIIDDLLAESGSIHTPVEATTRLAQLSEFHMLSRALTDEKIDGLVFGVESAYYLEGARHAIGTGNLELAGTLFKKAAATADSHSCPGGPSRLRGESDGSDDGKEEESNEDCDFISKKCPRCGAANVHTVVRKLEDGRKEIKGGCGCKKIV